MDETKSHTVTRTVGEDMSSRSLVKPDPRTRRAVCTSGRKRESSNESLIVHTAAESALSGNGEGGFPSTRNRVLSKDVAISPAGSEGRT